MANIANLPEKMLAVAITKPGGPRVLKAEKRDLPEPGEGEILIRVHAAGVNRPDVLQRKGAYPPPPGASDLPGLEVSGEVAALGAGAKLWRIGDAVCALTPGGGYAEYARVHETNALPLPAGFTYTEAAALPETFFTVWQNVFEIARLQAGETLLVQGGTSGIGVTATLLAKALGARVIATAGSDDKCAACLAVGADHAINYRTQDFADEALRLTGGKGVDVVLDMVAGDYVAREVQCLATDGRLAIIAVQGGTKSAIDSGLVLRKRLAITGSTLRPRALAYKARLAQGLRERVWPLLESGRVRPLIHRVFPAAEASAAHALMESGAHVGKIVLQW